MSHNFQSSSYEYFSEPRCGPLTGAPISLPIPCDVDVPQPLVDRRSSISLLKWGSCKRNEAPTPTAARQGLNQTFFSFLIMITNIFFQFVLSHICVFFSYTLTLKPAYCFVPQKTHFVIPIYAFDSHFLLWSSRFYETECGGAPIKFNNKFIYETCYWNIFYVIYARLVSFGGGGGAGSGINGNNIYGTRTEPISLSTLDRDCFIIPVHSLDRFLPAGIPVECFYWFLCRSILIISPYTRSCHPLVMRPIIKHILDHLAYLRCPIRNYVFWPIWWAH